MLNNEMKKEKRYLKKNCFFFFHITKKYPQDPTN